MSELRSQVEKKSFLPSQEVMEKLGFSELMATVASTAVRLGGRRVLEAHGKTAEELQLVLKAKEGDTPRTIADLRSGEIIKKLIRREFPGHKINEEEAGVDEGGGTEGGLQYAWHVDPLDGTSSFAREQRYSTVGIAVYEGDAPKVASLLNPFERELLVAEKGKGAYMFSLDEDLVIAPDQKLRRLEVSKAQSLKGAVAYVDALFNGKTTPRKLEMIRKLVERSGGNLGLRMTGSNIDQQRQVATGRAELTITDAVGGFFDLAAGALIIEEAGGKFTDAEGNPITEKTQIAFGSNGILHDQVLEIIRECYNSYEGFK